jgi:hypothetical protein
MTGVILLFVACASKSPPDYSGLSISTPVATLDTTNRVALCESVDLNWGKNWTVTIRSLEALQGMNVDCSDGFAVGNRLYLAYMSYGTLLEERGRIDEAVQAYETARAFDFTGAEAVARLRLLGVLTPEPPPSCESAIVEAALSEVHEFTPTTGDFVTIEGDKFVLSGQPFTVYGINYYPRDYPYKRFLTETDVESILFELDLMRTAGINTIRLYIRHDELFNCPGNGAIPIPENLARLDSLILAAAEREFKIILVLNYEPDLSVYPLYESPPHTLQQVQFIAQRYKNESAIIAYDLNDHGDLDFTSGDAQFTQSQVLQWLGQATTLVREYAPNQLVTVGWDNDSVLTAPLVDFVSFQNFGDVDMLRQEIALLKAETSKPILLASMGYSSLDYDEIGHRQAFQRAFEAVERNGLVGWVVWTAFDFPLNVTCIEPDCPGEIAPINTYGLWNTSYFPKRALDAVEQATGGKSFSGDNSG